MEPRRGEGGAEKPKVRVGVEGGGSLDRFLARGLFLLAAWGLSGCTDYTLETTVHADGSGLRVERVEVSENDDVEATAAEYPLVMHVTEREGWSHTVEVESGGDTIQVLQRRIPVKDLAAWSSLTGTFRIDGPAPVDAGGRIGYVTLGDVRFRNAVRVGRAEVSDGTTTFTYRETFTWARAVDALVEYFMAELDSALEGRYPRLAVLERGEIMGFMRARYWMALDQGLLGEDSDEEEMLTEAAKKTAAQGVKILRLSYPQARQEDLEALIEEIVLDDDRFVALARDLPGLDLAFNASVEFRLNLPGTVTDSNAHKRDGSTLVWEFGPADALLTPIEIYAESVSER
jgi:hypothetical protein